MNNTLMATSAPRVTGRRASERCNTRITVFLLLRSPFYKTPVKIFENIRNVHWRMVDFQWHNPHLTTPVLFRKWMVNINWISFMDRGLHAGRAFTYTQVLWTASSRWMKTKKTMKEHNVPVASGSIPPGITPTCEEATQKYQICVPSGSPLSLVPGISTNAPFTVKGNDRWAPINPGGTQHSRRFGEVPLGNNTSMRGGEMPNVYPVRNFWGAARTRLCSSLVPQIDTDGQFTVILDFVDEWTCDHIHENPPQWIPEEVRFTFGKGRGNTPCTVHIIVSSVIRQYPVPGGYTDMMPPLRETRLLVSDIATVSTIQVLLEVLMREMAIVRAEVVWILV
ncbi:hypothetical protein EDC04DRAFT_2602264 [Pisolithus marmoratus]|nr:hypothetical protein EDC04DRAFT_2602264 [Pisolithus marmoratus]